MTTVSDLTPPRRVRVEQLLRCLSSGVPADPPPPARARLDEALGPDLAQRLVRTLSIGSRGRALSP